jgi:CarD family transcriptional regulator
MEAAFSIGDKAYYPVHGVADVVGVERKDLGAGKKASFYILRIVESGLKIMVPTENANAVGLREIMSRAEVDEVYSILRSTEIASDTQTWNRRYREYMEKIKTGSAYEIAEVLRDLCLLRRSKDLSFGERRMLETARGLLVKEIALAKHLSENEIEREIEGIFQPTATA